MSVSIQERDADVRAVLGGDYRVLSSQVLHTPHGNRAYGAFLVEGPAGIANVVVGEDGTFEVEGVRELSVRTGVIE